VQRASALRRTSRRLGLFLGKDATERDALIARAAADYGERSSLAHGAGSTITVGQRNEQVHRTEDWIRDSLRRILLNPTLSKEFVDGARREAYLQALVVNSGLPLGGIDP